MDNVDYFNKYAARVLGMLYKSFPEPLALRHGELADEVLGPVAWQPDTITAADRGISRNAHDYPMERATEFYRQEALAWHTIQWLRECDYIRTNDTIDIRVRSTSSYVLSPKGLEVLATVPESLKSQRSLGDKLAEIGKGTADEASRATVSQLVGTVIGMALRVAAGAG